MHETPENARQMKTTKFTLQDCAIKIAGHIKKPLDIDAIVSEIDNQEYNAELILQHLLLWAVKTERFIKNFDAIRLQEFDDLQQIIRLAMELNNGSGVVQKIQIIEVLAHKLTKTDFVTPRSSFMLWLSETINDLQKQHNAEVTNPDTK